MSDYHCYKCHKTFKAIPSIKILCPICEREASEIRKGIITKNGKAENTLGCCGQRW